MAIPDNLLRPQRALLARIRVYLVLFMIGLVLSGLTAFPIETQLAMARPWLTYFSVSADFAHWFERVYEGVRETNARYPFMAYGTDWLAFAHLVIAVAFVGPLRDPVRNVWVVEFGMIACFAIFPLAFIAGEVRGIPLLWRMVDCSFGIAGGLLLIGCYRAIQRLAKMQTA